MPFRRPGAATAAGVLAIIYGSLFSLCGLCGLANMAAQGAMGNNFMAGNDPRQAQMQKELQDALERDAPAYQVYQIVGTVAGLGGALLLLIAGIGLLYLRGWARSLALVDCLVLVSVTLLQAVYVSVFVMPAVAQAFQVALPQAMPQGGAGPPPAEFLRGMQAIMNVMTVGAIVLYVVLVIYLLIIVFLLSRRDVRVAFAGPRQDNFAERPFDEEHHASGAEDDDDWENRRPPRDDWRVR